MADPVVLEVREPGREARRITVDRVIEVGRECDGEIVTDPSVSLRHCKLVASPVALSLVDWAATAARSSTVSRSRAGPSSTSVMSSGSAAPRSRSSAAPA
jgi:hypothetical protein